MIRRPIAALLAAGAMLGACGSQEIEGVPSPSSPPLDSVDASSECATRCDDTCVDLASNLEHCGACGRACRNGTCITGQCECTRGLSQCEDGCVDLAHDPSNCGACDKRCNDDEACSDGVCTCELAKGRVICEGQCVDPESDPANCGACGVRCDGGCHHGQCTSQLVVADVAHASDIVVDASGVYLTSWREVVRFAHDGSGTPITLDHQLVTHPTALATNDSDVYWGTSRNTFFEMRGGALMRCTKSACNPHVVVPTGDVDSIALSATHVFWSETLTSSGAIRSCPLSGCGSSPATVFEKPDATFPKLAVTPNALVFYDRSAILQCPLTGCAGAPQPFDPPFDNPLEFTTDATNMYVVDGNGVVSRCALSGCATWTPLGPALVEPIGKFNPVGVALACDGANVYAAPLAAEGYVARDLTIRKCAVTGCENPTPVGSGYVTSLAVYGDYVYWLTPFGSVMRTKK